MEVDFWGVLLLFPTSSHLGRGLIDQSKINGCTFHSGERELHCICSAHFKGSLESTGQKLRYIQEKPQIQLGTAQLGTEVSLSQHVTLWRGNTRRHMQLYNTVLGEENKSLPDPCSSSDLICIRFDYLGNC